MRAAHEGIERRTFLTLAAGAMALTLPGWLRARAGAEAPTVGDLPDGSTLTGIAGMGGRLVAVGSDANGRAAVWHTDGGAWRLGESLPSAAALLGDVVATGTSFLAVGSLQKVPSVWSSADGSRWDQLTTFAGPGHLTSAAVSGATVVVGGAVLDDEADEGLGPLLATVSRSGRWGRVSTAGMDLPHGSVTAVASQADRWVVAGTSTAMSGLWSADGGGWTVAPVSDPMPVVWSSLLSLGQDLLALGVDLAGEARLARSTDGRSWLTETVPATLTQLGIDLRAATADLASGVVSVAGLDRTVEALGLR